MKKIGLKFCRYILKVNNFFLFFFLLNPYSPFKIIMEKILIYPYKRSLIGTETNIKFAIYTTLIEDDLISH